MKIIKMLSAITVLVLLVMNAKGLLAQDWPQWRGVDRDGKAIEYKAPEQWPAELAKKWSVHVGAGDASPVIVGEKLYVFARQDDAEILLCLNAADGKELWRSANPAPDVKGPAGSHPGPRSTPTVAEGRVVTLGAGGILTCTDAKAGKVVWRKEKFSSVPDFFTSMSPIVVDGLCVAHLGGKDDGVVVAFDMSSGAEKWRWAQDAPTYSSPVVVTIHGKKQIVLYSDKNLLSFDPASGALLWSIPTPTERRFYSCGTPIIKNNRIIITGQGLGTKAVEIGAAPGYAVKELWSNAEYGISFNTPILANGLLYGIEASKGHLYCIDASNGKTAWADTIRLDRFGSVIDAGSALFASSAKADLAAFAPTSEKFIKLAHYKVSEKAMYAHPIVADKKVYVKDEDTLSLFILP